MKWIFTVLTAILFEIVCIVTHVIGLCNCDRVKIVLIVFVMLLLFGAKGIPNIAKGLGKGIREFKDATSNIQKDIQNSTGGITEQINEHIQEIKKEVEKD